MRIGIDISIRGNGVGGGGAAPSPYEQILALANADGWLASYDPTNPDTRTLRVSGEDTFVTASVDGLGNRETIVQATEARQPKLITGAFGSLDALDRITIESLNANLTNISQPFAMTMVFKWTSGVGTIVQTDGSGNGFRMQGGTAYRVKFGLNLDFSFSDTNPHVVTVIANGASSSLRLDGVSQGSGDAGTAALDVIDLPATAGTSGVVGRIGPLLIRDDVSTAEIAAMEELLLGFF